MCINNGFGIVFYNIDFLFRCIKHKYLDLEVFEYFDGFIDYFLPTLVKHICV